MFPPGTRGRARGLPYTMDAFMLGMGMLGESGPGPGNRVTPSWTSCFICPSISFPIYLPSFKTVATTKLAEIYRGLTHRRYLILFFPLSIPFFKRRKSYSLCLRLLYWHGALKHLRTPAWLKLMWAEAALSLTWKRRGYGRVGDNPVCLND